VEGEIRLRRRLDGEKVFSPEKQLGEEFKEPVAIVVAQFLLSLFQAQTLAEKKPTRIERARRTRQQALHGNTRDINFATVRQIVRLSFPGLASAWRGRNPWLFKATCRFKEGIRRRHTQKQR
jgi:hypothetical protein